MGSEGRQLKQPAHSRGLAYLIRMDECCAPPPLNLGGSRKQDDAYRRVLWAVLAINAAMFAVEVIAGLVAGSAALQADALDFLGDAANYAISLLVVGMALRYRASAALAKGATMAAFGLWVIGTVIWHALHGTLPSGFTMGTVGVAALVANVASFGLLWALSSWRCQYALRVDLHPQRCTRQSGGSVGGAWRLWHRHGMA
jgi:Co/Zn/Cd efflux system component